MPDLIERNIEPSEGPDIFFVVGAPRSGTKLLRHLLNQNPCLAMTTNETEFLPFLMRYAADGGFERQGGFGRFLEYLRLEDYFTHREIEGHEATDFEAWQARCRDNSVAEMFRAFLIGDADGVATARLLGDKSPGYLRILPQILTEFPRAKVIHAVRDPRSQVGSLRATFGKSVVASAIAWRDAIDRVSRLRSVHEDRILELRYEDITEAPELWLRRVCAFLEVPFDPAMLSVRSELERARPGTKPVGLRKADLKAFETYLSRREIALVEACCATGMAQHGYDRLTQADAKPRFPVRLMKLQRAIGLARLAILTVRRQGWPALMRKLRLARARRQIMAGRW